MRNVCIKVLTIGLVVLAASPAFAQQQGRQGRGGRGGFGRGEMTAATLLTAPQISEKVQEELKLTDDQKSQIAKITDKYKEDTAKALADRNFEKMGELRKAEGEDLDKALPTILKPDQTKRLKQLELQAGMQFGGLRVLTKEDVQTALKLTDEQKKNIKESSEELTKDMEEMRQNAQGDRTKAREMFTKMQTMQKEATEKVVNSFTPEQKKEWKELTGEKFEFPAFGGGRPGGRRPGAGTPPPENNK